MNQPIRTEGYAHPPATIRLGDLEVQRMGFGAMRLPGKDVYGEPDDPEHAKKVLRRAIELGINLIDTAWFYGPHVANRLIAEALYPYPRDLVIATKLGGRRGADKSWQPATRPEQLKADIEHDLRALRLERLDVVHLRYMPGSAAPFLESLDALIALQKEGKIRHLALSSVDAHQIEQALARTPIVAVQNMYNVSGGKGALAKAAHAELDDPEAVLELCEKKNIAYLPYFPLAMGNVDKEKPIVVEIAQRHRASTAQIALAWLLARSPLMLPIPGTSSPDHLEENWEARRIRLTTDEIAAIAG
jgi:aryl-alcohol dehydrogenase-like predicted oxidoreductase